tara:strand:+ start:15745 stop:15864 length:120 start_codon:yes stop_codon:yes gene_type:complete
VAAWKKERGCVGSSPLANGWAKKETPETASSQKQVNPNN